MAHQGDSERRAHDEIGDRLNEEFSGVHPTDTVARCVAAARHGAQEVTGAAPDDLVERIARKHLQVLAIVAAEKRRHSPRTTTGNTP
ncbi:three-helix bundle dimerization domain-containing protein [Spirillospora sp. CA-294931]|uniref:three-helix bundle dimerization domain-containing protein n=1 Tax=Spirillospora sp. CA-294931 TaxID=3240042 RepID=UPI003D93BE73